MRLPGGPRWAGELNDEFAAAAQEKVPPALRLASRRNARQSVILKPDDYGRWLDPKNTATDELQSLLGPYPAEQMAKWPVSTRVKNPRNDVPECVESSADGE